MGFLGRQQSSLMRARKFTGRTQRQRTLERRRLYKGNRLRTIDLVPGDQILLRGERYRITRRLTPDNKIQAMNIKTRDVVGFKPSPNTYVKALGVSLGRKRIESKPAITRTFGVDANNDGIIDGGSINDYIQHWGHSSREVGTLTDLDGDGTIGN